MSKLLRDGVVAHGYSLPDVPGVLCVGYMQGRERPMMWLQRADGTQVILAAFYGEEQVQLGVDALDVQVEQINRAMAFWQGKLSTPPDDTGDTHGQN